MAHVLKVNSIQLVFLNELSNAADEFGPVGGVAHVRGEVDGICPAANRQ